MCIWTQLLADMVGQPAGVLLVSTAFRPLKKESEDRGHCLDLSWMRICAFQGSSVV